jgi:hypothetical protein
MPRPEPTPRPQRNRVLATRRVIARRGRIRHVLHTRGQQQVLPQARRQLARVRARPRTEPRARPLRLLLCTGTSARLLRSGTGARIHSTAGSQARARG